MTASRNTRSVSISDPNMLELIYFASYINSRQDRYFGVARFERGSATARDGAAIVCSDNGNAIL